MSWASNKFADDMPLVRLQLNEDSLATYFHVSFLNEWCKESLLEMNVGKTKELVLDARKTTNVFVPVKVNNEPVEMVSNFKYLGTLIDTKLRFNDNTDLMYKKSQQSLYHLRKLRSFDVSHELLQIVHKSLSACVRACVRVCVCVCVRACVRACVCVCVCVKFIYCMDLICCSINAVCIIMCGRFECFDV